MHSSFCSSSLGWHFFLVCTVVVGVKVAHLNRNKIESNLSVPGIQGCQENAFIESFEMSSHLIYLWAIIQIPLGPARIQTWLALQGS